MDIGGARVAVADNQILWVKWSINSKKIEICGCVDAISSWSEINAYWQYLSDDLWLSRWVRLNIPIEDSRMAGANWANLELSWSDCKVVCSLSLKTGWEQSTNNRGITSRNMLFTLLIIAFKSRYFVLVVGRCILMSLLIIFLS